MLSAQVAVDQMWWTYATLRHELVGDFVGICMRGDSRAVAPALATVSAPKQVGAPLVGPPSESPCHVHY